VIDSGKTEVAKKRDLEKFLKQVEETTKVSEELAKSLEKTKTAAQEAVEKGKKSDEEKAKNASGISYEKFGHFSDTKRYLIYSQIKDEYNSWRNRFNGDNFLSEEELNIFTNFTENSY
jgi:hypothetical protein